MVLRTAVRRSAHPSANPECTQQESQSVEGIRRNVKSVSQLRIVAPEPANAAMMREREGSREMKPLMSVREVSFLRYG